MKTFEISTALLVFKERLIANRLLNLKEYVDTANDIQNSLLNNDFEKSLDLLNTFNFSWYKNEDTVEKELVKIIEKKILSTYIYHLEEIIININKMALSLLPCDFVIADVFYPSGLVKNDLDFESSIKKIEGETFEFKDTIVYLFKSSLAKQSKMAALKKQLAES